MQPLAGEVIQERGCGWSRFCAARTQAARAQDASIAVGLMSPRLRSEAGRR